jgi:hypothetical protein
MNVRPALVALVLILGCTTATQTPAPAPPSPFKNVQVLPHTMSRQDLIATMKSFTRGLGVRCGHCHVVTATEPKEEFDFPSDAKEEKRVARVMIQMATQINSEWMKRVAAAEGQPPEPDERRVWCWTCHRGKQLPEAPPPPPAPGEPPPPPPPSR